MVSCFKYLKKNNFQKCWALLLWKSRLFKRVLGFQPDKTQLKALIITHKVMAEGKATFQNPSSFLSSQELLCSKWRPLTVMAWKNQQKQEDHRNIQTMQQSCSELVIFLCKSLCKHSVQFHICGSLHPPHLIFRYKLTQTLILIINIPSYISPKFPWCQV